MRFLRHPKLLQKRLSINIISKTYQFLSRHLLKYLHRLRKTSIRPYVLFHAGIGANAQKFWLNLAKAYPNVHFIAVGGSRDPHYDQKIRQQLKLLPNVEIHGMINQFESDELSKIYSQSWILLNTASREGFPISFIEASGARCAILSAVNPDDFCSRFGYYAGDDDFVSGMDYLLSEDRWKSLGEAGYEYVKDTFDFQKAIKLHEEAYKKII